MYNVCIIAILIIQKHIGQMFDFVTFTCQTEISPFVPRVGLNFFLILYFDFRIADSRPAKYTTGRRTQLSSSNILEQTRATANKAFRFQRDSDQSNFGSWPAEQISRCECNLLFLTRKRGRNRQPTYDL